MLTFTTHQMAVIDRGNAFMRLHEFIKAKCKRVDFVQWLEQKVLSNHSSETWLKVWPECVELAEVDAMLLLTFSSVCEYEKLPMRPVRELATNFIEWGPQIRSYFEKRQYFRFSEFDIDLDSLNFGES